ncbi:MAG: SDR family oxidoreductase [Pseudomonadales bacterium]
MAVKRDIALITGASSGIGEALALVCAQHQYDLILVARNQQKLETLATQLNQQYGVEVSVKPCDLVVPGAVKLLSENLLSEGKQVDILINNAGVLEHGAFVNIPPDDHQNIVQLNVVALTAMLAHLLPAMVARGSGRVLNVASLGAFQPMPSVATYAATKAFVLSLSEALAEELKGTGVTVTALCPGLTATNMMASAQQKSKALKNIPNIVVADAYSVAQKGFSGCLKGKAIVVPGAKNRFASIVSRATPKWLVRRVTGFFGRATIAP